MASQSMTKVGGGPAGIGSQSSGDGGLGGGVCGRGIGMTVATGRPGQTSDEEGRVI